MSDTGFVCQQYDSSKRAFDPRLERMPNLDGMEEETGEAIAQDTSYSLSGLWQDRFHAAHITLRPNQQTAHEQARQCDAPDGPSEVLYVDGHEAGKSFWLAAQICVDDCLRSPGLQALILLHQPVHTYWLEIMRIRQRLRQECDLATPHLLFYNGSRLTLAALSAQSALTSYLRKGYGVIGIETNVTFSETDLAGIRNSLRAHTPEWRPRVYRLALSGGAMVQEMSEAITLSAPLSPSSLM